MRYGLVGTGYWAAEVHAQGLTTSADADLIGVWGRDAAKVSALAERYNVAAYRDPGGLFADVDAVAFAVPPDVQAALAVEAATAGCHLLLEKPIALGSDAARRIADAADAHGVATVVFLTSRFVPAVADWLEETRARGGWWGARSTILTSVLSTDSPFAASPWRHTQGALWDIGPHALSLTVAVLGPVTRITGVRGPRDSVQLAAGHSEGGVSSVLLSLDAPPAAEHRGFEVFGEHGWAPAPTDHGVTPVEAFCHAAAALATAANGGTPHPCDVHLGVELVENLERAQDELR